MKLTLTLTKMGFLLTNSIVYDFDTKKRKKHVAHTQNHLYVHMTVHTRHETHTSLRGNLARCT